MFLESSLSVRVVFYGMVNFGRWNEQKSHLFSLCQSPTPAFDLTIPEILDTRKFKDMEEENDQNVNVTMDDEVLNETSTKHLKSTCFCCQYQ